MQELVKRFGEKIIGVLSCFDRVVVMGTIPEIRYSGAMENTLRSHGIRLFDYTQWAKPLRDTVRENAGRVAKEYGLKIQHLRNVKRRKDKIIKKVIEERGDHPGLVHIFSAMETCRTYQHWHDKGTGKTMLKSSSGALSALLLLLHRRTLWPMLHASSHLGSISTAVLF